MDDGGHDRVTDHEMDGTGTMHTANGSEEDEHEKRKPSTYEDGRTGRTMGNGRSRGVGRTEPREEATEPSKVLHVRNVGYPVTQTDLVNLFSRFGTVEKLKMFHGQALIQLSSISVAKATFRHFTEDEEPRVG
ncbi:unnamed protein product, partial [Discosporangium mesarthrocarpum]